MKMELQPPTTNTFTFKTEMDQTTADWTAFERSRMEVHIESKHRPTRLKPSEILTTEPMEFGPIGFKAATDTKDEYNVESLLEMVIRKKLNIDILGTFQVKLDGEGRAWNADDRRLLYVYQKLEKWGYITHINVAVSRDVYEADADLGIGLLLYQPDVWPGFKHRRASEYVLDAYIDDMCRRLMRSLKG